MIVSTRGRYVLHVMVDLAQCNPNDYMPMKDVAKRNGISLKYLEKILPVLTQAGLVDALHGKGGGYRLTRKPEEYTVGEILRLTEGSLSPVSCVENGNQLCEHITACPTLPMWKEFDRITNEYFDGITIADLVKQVVNHPGVTL